jgi:hypothetical protein
MTNSNLTITAKLREKYSGTDWCGEVFPFILVFDVEPEVVLSWLDKTSLTLVQKACSWCFEAALDKLSGKTLDMFSMPNCLLKLKEAQPKEENND